jgi:hypothetical protein
MFQPCRSWRFNQARKSDARTHAHSKSWREMKQRSMRVSHDVLWSAMRPRIALAD